VVEHDVSIVGEPLIAERASFVLSSDLPVEELPHFSVEPELSHLPAKTRALLETCEVFPSTGPSSG